MRRKDPKYALYCKRRLRKLERAKKRKNGVRSNHSGSLNVNRFNYDMAPKVYISNIPECFSIVTNPNETIHYFNLLINRILRDPSIKRIYFEFRKVKEMTVDALMYLLAILKFLQCKVWEFSGDVPIQNEPKELLLQSGFLKRITRHRISVQPNGKFYMSMGNSADGIETKKVCEFLYEHSDAQRQTTNFIYDMLMELEVNTADHAYKTNSNSLFHDNWLLVVEDNVDRFSFTFLDVGVGICKTIYKRWHERLNLGKTQYDYLLSAFDGKLLRSETKERHRGRGLPKIKKYATENRIINLTVITNKAICSSSDKCILEGQRIDESLAGAIYYWEVTKSSIRYEKEAS